MLKLINIKKDYPMADTVVNALRGVSIEFRQQEFVAILGQSGCGKTTMLNIVGGLDRYTSGDLQINGKSTTKFNDSDWDTYRNNTIGFVFQNYNLIPHLTVLGNVEIALTLSGISAKERTQRAKEALNSVGLESQYKKRPNQLSGGQMQRVAIARALVNNPKVILADEPTGALDSTTSAQIMDILKEISKERLIIMVTHNQEIADTYASRIVRLTDGLIISDSNPYDSKLDEKEKGDYNKGIRKTSMSFTTALNLSFQNLRSKKTRTIITSIAGSIGIVGIALVLAISAGMNSYVGSVQESTLSGFPISINASTTTYSSDIRENMGQMQGSTSKPPLGDNVYPYDPTGGTPLATTHVNMIGDANQGNFYDYLFAMDKSLYTNITVNKTVPFNLVVNAVNKGGVSGYRQLNTSSGGLMDTIASQMGMSASIAWQMLPDNVEFLLSQYEIISGSYPTQSNEILLVLDNQNRISTTTLEQLGFSYQIGNQWENPSNSTTIGKPITYEDFYDYEIKLIHNNEFFVPNGSNFIKIMGAIKQSDLQTSEVYGAKVGFYPVVTNEQATNMYTSTNNTDIKISGVLRPRQDASNDSLSAGLAYLSSLRDEMLADSLASDIVAAKKANADTLIYYSNGTTTNLSIANLGGDASITGISIYTATFDERTKVKAYIDEWNAMQTDDIGYDNKLSQYENNLNGYYSKVQKRIIYSDTSAMISASISKLIDTISIVLSAFAAISLVVSSIMIGIITYVSVVERTKEIGVLRAIGARKKDVGNVFNAETVIIGFFAGLIGVVAAYLISIPVNLIVGSLVGVYTLAALPITQALLLVTISVALTFVAGLFPSSIAAKKDPVVALRSE